MNSKSVKSDEIYLSKHERKITLKLACFPKEHIKKCIEILESGQELTANTSPIEPQWPDVGLLIIKINEDNPEISGKTWLPEKLVRQNAVNFFVEINEYLLRAQKICLSPSSDTFIKEKIALNSFNYLIYQTKCFFFSHKKFHHNRAPNLTA